MSENSTDQLLRLVQLCAKATVEGDAWSLAVLERLGVDSTEDPPEWVRSETLWAVIGCRGVWYFGPDQGDGNTHHFTLPDLGDDADAALAEALTYMETK